MKKLSILVTLITSVILSSGCASVIDIKDSLSEVDEKNLKTFTYTYKDPAFSKGELWNLARGYLDKQDDISFPIGKLLKGPAVTENRSLGLLSRRGFVEWNLGLQSCVSVFHVSFTSKDGEGDLFFKVIKDPVFNPMGCAGWGLPTQKGYESMKSRFQELAEGLRDTIIAAR